MGMPVHNCEVVTVGVKRRSMEVEMTQEHTRLGVLSDIQNTFWKLLKVKVKVNFFFLHY